MIPHIFSILLIYASPVVLCQYYHYYNLTKDPLEATNLYYDPASKETVNSLEAAGRSWVSQVGTTEYPGSPITYRYNSSSIIHIEP